MTEEINHAYDGGLYAELIQNRTFQDPIMPARGGGRGRGAGNAGGGAGNGDQPARPEMVGEGEHAVPKMPLHWTEVSSEGAKGEAQADVNEHVNTTGLPVSLRVDIQDVPAGGRVGVANEGYWGIPVKPDTTYVANFYAKSAQGFSGPLTVDIETNDGKAVATGAVPALTGDWKKYTVDLKTGNVPATKDARFVISGASKGTVWLSDVSLFPPTYKDRANGDRVDISKLLADMDPSFLRFPGGNYLEGDTPETRFNWMKMIGPVVDRPGHMGTWSYRSSDGFGLDEFLGWCQDLHMMPVLAVYAGYSLRGQHITGDDLKPYVQEALDEIEYVSGDASTKWGALRAKNGYPKPFDLKYVEIGNEDFFDGRRGGTNTYDERFAAFYDAIKAKYPNLQCIATTPVKSRKPDVVDDHYYQQAQEMWAMSQLYDKKDRSGPKVFVGEWATREGNPTPDMNAALGDAAFLTGLERNSDIVVMSCYAPLFVNVSDTTNPNQAARSMEWATDLIGYDALSSYGSPAYYVQKMFIHNKGDDVLPVTLDVPGTDGGVLPAPAAATQGRNGAPARGRPRSLGGVFVEASNNRATSEVILKVVNAQAEAQTLKIDLEGIKDVDNKGIIETLQGEPTDVNTIAEPEKVAPRTEGLPVSGTTFTHEFPAHSVSVLRVKVK
ncbi:MAG TPA: alpha-L-arabinofuranosidase C-terminal domain-containing protein [Phycisphaerae bacterium]|nr:alpha-L-arabinofuranosidase C-terminal domain-containing protein [Phycisphaerae bacterium]